jgi:CheY-like chemotaxis protein
MISGIAHGLYPTPPRKAILCLSYDRNMLHVRKMLLEHFGYQVFPTASVEDATSVARHQCPDMLLMDNTRPDIDFEQVARQVKRACPGTIAVILSPYHYAQAQACSGAIDHYVAKDDGPDALISRIEELLGEPPRDCDSAPHLI